ncbi:hypothetical protein AOLI_G00190140 [Acnodon oligacanthus]
MQFGGTNSSIRISDSLIPKSTFPSVEPRLDLAGSLQTLRSSRMQLKVSSEAKTVTNMKLSQRHPGVKEQMTMFNTKMRVNIPSVFVETPHG